jgi:hypothetical protein
VETHWAYGGKQGIAEGFVPSVVAGQQLSFTACSGYVQERDGSGNLLSRGYEVWNDGAIQVMVTSTGATTGGAGDGSGNISDVDITTNWPSLLTLSEQAMAIIDRSTSDPGGTGVSFGRARITSKIELTSLMSGTTFLNGAPCLLAHECDL